MNIIDSLIITLGLDPANFKKGVKESDEAQKKLGQTSDATQKKLDLQGKKAAESFAKLRNEVLGLTAAFLSTSGLKSMVDKLTTADASTGRLAGNLGLATKQLSQFEMAARQLGSTKGDIDGAFASLVKIQEEFKLKGSSGALTGAIGQAFGMFGTSAGWAQFQDATRSGDTLKQFRELADLASKMAPKDRQSLFQEAGFSESQINLMSQGNAVIDQAVASNDRYATTLEQVALAKARQNKEGEIQNRLEGTWQKILEKASPVIMAVLDALSDLIGFANNHIPLTITLMAALGAAMTAIAAISFVGLLGGIAGIAAAVAGVAAGAVALAPLAATAAIAGAAGYGAYKLSQAVGGGSAAPTASGATSSSSALFSRLEGSYGLPAGILDSIWAQESGRGKNMRSKAGALGHFGLMPGTAAELGVQNPNDLTQSAEGAAHYLSRLLKMFHGNLPKALAGYNWGAGNVMRQGLGNAPLETLNYMSQVPARMAAGGGGGTHIQIDKVEVTSHGPSGKDVGRDMYGAVVAAAQANRGLQ